RYRPIAIVGIFSEPERGVADVWVADRLTGKATVRHIEGESGRDPSVLAVRAVEVLRASLLELVVEQVALTTPKPEGADSAAAHGGVRVPPRVLGLEIGAAMLHSFEQLGSAFAPVVRVEYRPATFVAFRIGAAGLGTRPVVEAPAGSARIRQETV